MSEEVHKSKEKYLYVEGSKVWKDVYIYLSGIDEAEEFLFIDQSRLKPIEI